MKKTWVLLSVVAVVSLGSISYSLANIELNDHDKGTEFAKYYKKALEKNNDNKITIDTESEKISQDELTDKLARYQAYSKAFGIKLTEEDAMKKLEERTVLAEYAREHDIYPTEEEIKKHIKEMADSYKEHKYDVVAGIIEGLDITEDEFFFEFSRDGYEEELVRLNILNKIKSENEMLDGEDEIEYHKRMLSKLNDLIEELK